MPQSMADRDELIMDVVAYPTVAGGPAEAMLPEDLGRYRNRLKIGGIKLMLDGSPQGKTAYLTKPYLVPPLGQTADYRGYPAYAENELNGQVKHFLDAGIPILAHANGDAAADMLIRAVELAAPCATINWIVWPP